MGNEKGNAECNQQSNSTVGNRFRNSPFRCAGSVTIHDGHPTFLRLLSILGLLSGLPFIHLFLHEGEESQHVKVGLGLYSVLQNLESIQVEGVVVVGR